MKFPKDENGELLREMHEAGIDLTEPRNIEFFAFFSTKKDAEAMVAALASDSDVVNTSLEHNEIQDDWDLCCSIQMVPSHAAITLRELSFTKLAEKHNGESDGWGVMEE